MCLSGTEDFSSHPIDSSRAKFIGYLLGTHKRSMQSVSKKM